MTTGEVDGDVIVVMERCGGDREVEIATGWVQGSEFDLRLRYYRFTRCTTPPRRPRPRLNVKLIPDLILPFPPA